MILATSTSTTTTTTTTTKKLVLTLGIDDSVTFNGPYYWTEDDDPTPAEITTFIVWDVDTAGGLKERLTPILCATADGTANGTGGDRYWVGGCDFGAELSFFPSDKEYKDEDEDLRQR